MKLAEISKAQFKGLLKDPATVKVRAKIRELRKELKEVGWRVNSSYNKKENTYKLYVYSMSAYIDHNDPYRSFQYEDPDHTGAAIPTIDKIFYDDKDNLKDYEAVIEYEHDSPNMKVHIYML